MKNIKIWLLLLCVGFSSAGCDKDFDEINTNPNKPEEVPLTNILISGITQGVRRIHGASFDMTYAGLWAQQYAKIQYIDEDWYAYRPDAMDIHWQGLYAGPLSDLQDILNRAPNPSNMRAAAMVMRAYYFGVITDMWGDVPYSEALSIDRVITPKYDSQADIYAALISELRTAASMFDANGDALGAGDVIYAGDVNKWKKFANSLRARLLNRAKHKNAAFATELQTLLSNPADLIASNDENAQMSYLDATTDGANPLYSNKYNDARNDHATSATMVTILTGDPRLPVYAELNDAGIYKGQPNGTTEPVPFTSISAIGAAFRDDPSAPSVLMTYAEVLFIIAEANGNKQAYLDVPASRTKSWKFRCRTIPAKACRVVSPTLPSANRATTKPTWKLPFRRNTSTLPVFSVIKCGGRFKQSSLSLSQLPCGIPAREFFYPVSLRQPPFLPKLASLKKNTVHRHVFRRPHPQKKRPFSQRHAHPGPQHDPVFHRFWRLDIAGPQCPAQPGSPVQEHLCRHGHRIWPLPRVAGVLGLFLMSE